MDTDCLSPWRSSVIMGSLIYFFSSQIDIFKQKLHTGTEFNSKTNLSNLILMLDMNKEHPKPIDYSNRCKDALIHIQVQFFIHVTPGDNLVSSLYFNFSSLSLFSCCFLYNA